MTEEFKGYAAMQSGTHLQPWSYTPRPLGDNDVEIKVNYCGVCHSDLHQMTEGWGGSIFPMIPGHEVVGRVVAKGKDVKHIQIGQRVGVGPNCLSCFKCPQCADGEESFCAKKTDTYNDRYPDGTPSRGGYAEKIRVHEKFAFEIPEGLSSAGAAPLLCAGITTWTPFRVHKIKKGDKVAILGIGGLGHLGVKWAKALGCHVTVLSTSDAKREWCSKQGVDDYVVIYNKEEMDKRFRTLDFILATSCGSDTKWKDFLDLLRVDGTLCLVGLPEEDIKIPPFSIIPRKNFTGSAVGGSSFIKDMFQFASEHKIESDVQVFPLEQVDEAIKGLKEGKPRFRYVLKVADE
jgi:uncharacterized zinc-type alcohol dehydrogenase-like protein